MQLYRAQLRICHTPARRAVRTHQAHLAHRHTHRRYLQARRRGERKAARKRDMRAESAPLDGKARAPEGILRAQREALQRLAPICSDPPQIPKAPDMRCLLYTSDAADD